jgi:hypothetical protein
MMKYLGSAVFFCLVLLLDFFTGGDYAEIVFKATESVLGLLFIHEGIKYEKRMRQIRNWECEY